MMEICKVCKKPYKRLTLSHIQKHNINREEYESYGEIKPLPPGTVIKSAWDSIDTENLEYRIKYEFLKGKIIHLSDNNVVDLRKGKVCEFCKNKIEEMVVFIILDPGQEVYLSRPTFMKKPYHKHCAIAISSKAHRIASVMNPIKFKEEKKVNI